MNSLNILKEGKLKKTASRIAILDALQSTAVPMSENEIKEQMGDTYDRITFYRSVQIMLDADIIHRIVADNVTVRYALNHQAKHNHTENHVHFFCKQCHLVICFYDVKAYHYKLPEGFTPEECEVVIKGLCKICSTDIRPQ